MRISDWSSDVCSSDLRARRSPSRRGHRAVGGARAGAYGRSHPRVRLVPYRHRRDAVAGSPGLMSSRAACVKFAGLPSRGCDGNRTVESQMKQSLIGCAALVALAVIFMTLLVKGTARARGGSGVPVK